MYVYVYIYIYIYFFFFFIFYFFFFFEHMLGFNIPRTLSSWNMHHSAHLSVQWACCLDIGFCHMFSAPDCTLLTEACSLWPKKGMTQSLWPTEYMYAVKVFLIYSDNVLMYIA